MKNPAVSERSRKMTRKEIAEHLEESRRAQGLIRTEEWNGLVPGDLVRLVGCGMSRRRTFPFVAHYTSLHRGTEWVDVARMEDDIRVLYPVRPECIVKVRKT